MIFHSLPARANTFMPPQGTEVASQFDTLYAFLLIASLISFIILIGGLFLFVMKYKRKSIDDKTAYITHNTFLEFLWSFIPFVIFMVVAVWGIVIYNNMKATSEDAVEIHVIGKKWQWDFLYKNGKTVTNTTDTSGNIVYSTMIVPEKTPIKLIMTSREQSDSVKPVIHSFFIPAFRIKQDVVPGKYSSLYFTADKKGEFQVFCTEYCGDAHSKMLAKVRVVSKEEYDQWLIKETEALMNLANLSPAELGKLVYQQNQCSGCHTINGSPLVGPSFKGLLGSDRKFADGATQKADENYIRASILNPNGQVVEGFQSGVMPVYKGVLTDEQISQVIEFIKSLN